MRRLDSYDRAILRFLYKKKRGYNANQIAESLNISWNTVGVHLRKLRNMGFLIAKKEGKYWYWYLT